jgi:apolipoprotein N-acyltransferase
MEENLTMFRNTRNSKIVLGLSVFTVLFWWLSHVIDVYHFAFVGAIFELLWVFAVGMLFGLPIYALVFWIKERCNPRSLYLVSLLIMVSFIVFEAFYR